MVSTGLRGVPYVSSVSEETYDELNYLLREMMFDEAEREVQTRIYWKINIASGDDLFTKHGELLYGSLS